VVASVCGFLIGNTHENTDTQDSDISIRQSGYTFTNPLLECENNGSFAKQKYIPFEQNTIKRLTEEVQKSNSGVEMAIYFRNLNNGPWFGINENARFLPASLMKVTLLISYLKWWEDDPTLFDKKLKVSSEVGLNQLIPPDKKLEIGKEYTIHELLEYLIMYSDNTASRVLFEYIPFERQNKTFIDLGVPLPSMDPNYSLSVKEYASFFRVLYNASYLSRKSSEEGLHILSQSAFHDGIVAPLPSNLTVAHKF
jgi:beta-lactamase class A